MAYRLLSVRTHSEHELAVKLRRKGLDAEVIIEVISMLREYGMIDDADYAGGYIMRRIKRKPVGRALIVQELKQKGIAGDIIESQITGIDPETEYKTALALARKKMDGQGGEFAYPRIASFLWRRGFDGETIARVCRRLEDGETLDSP